MHRFVRSVFVAGVLSSSALLAATGPSSAESAGALFAKLQENGAGASYAQFRGRRGGFHGHRRFHGHRGFHRRGFAGRRHYGGPYRGYGYRRPGIGAGAVIGGLAAGAIVGGALAAGANAAPARNDAYCSRKFKSYDPASGTYLGYDGKRHACP